VHLSSNSFSAAESHQHKLIESHIDELRERCEAAAEMDFVSGSLIWTEYFESNYSFFSMMLASKENFTIRNEMKTNPLESDQSLC
jgi:hypothetical protein